MGPLSPNARVVWRLFLPSLFAKSMWYAWSTGDIIANLRSLLWGLTICGYPHSWWKPQFRRCSERYKLYSVFQLPEMHQWVKQGRTVGTGSE